MGRRTAHDCGRRGTTIPATSATPAIPATPATRELPAALRVPARFTPRVLAAFPSHLALLALVLLPAFLVGGCGGGGSGEAGTGGSSATLTYGTVEALYRTGQAIPDNEPLLSGGTASSYTVNPALPAGLSLHSATGIISGTPTEATPADQYAVTAAVGTGAASTTLRIEVMWPPVASLAPKADGFADADLRHFLLRTHWGIREGNYDALVDLGIETYLDSILEMAPIGSTSHEVQADAFLLRSDDPPGQEGMFPTRGQLAQWWLALMILNPNTFQEVLAFFWHDHFATSSSVLINESTHWMKNHVNVFRQHGAGNLRVLITEVARDWAMLQWLDGLFNRASAPNENFAREYLELFMLGVDKGYSQTDIEEASRAFTGYRPIILDDVTKLRGVRFDARFHDPDDKTIFGVTIPGQNEHDDYEAVVDITLAQRDAAGWIALSILKYFCTPDPAPELVADVAELLVDSGYELAPVLRALFLSEAFYAPESRASLVRGPVSFGIGFINTTGLVIHPRELVTRTSALGQVPTAPPSVNGWPGGTKWLSAQGMVDRANLLSSCIRGRVFQNTQGVDVADLLPPGTPSSGEVVDALAARLGLLLEAQERATCMEYLDTTRLADGTVVASPFDPANPAHVEDRVRGLLYILGQHPAYMLR